MKRMNPVVHFEMPAEDRKRMADFYTKVFGWEAQFFGKEMGDYVTVKTTETDDLGFPLEPGSINGGFFPKTDDFPSRTTSIVISVDDINEAAEKVMDAGGDVFGEPVNIPGIGLYLSFMDTEGNTASLLQPVMPDGEKVDVEDVEGVED